MDYRTLAAWNDISSPYIIKPGQRLTLVAPARQTTKNAAAPKPSTAKPQPKAAPPPVTQSGWLWPVEGPVLSTFSTAKGSKGIDIGGTSGTSIRAASGGRVVYAGSGLRGYGKLIIVKHDEVYLSAYAHNSKLLVEDGATVIKGQQIALMGKTGTDRVKLHFEIRRKGKPVDPLKYLSKRP